MKSGKYPFNRLWVINPWCHVIFWYMLSISVLILFSTALTTIFLSTFRDLLSEGTWSNIELSFFISLVATIILFAAWRRFLFLKSDLSSLLIYLGAVPEISKRNIQSRLGNILIYAKLDRPYRDYWPHPRASYTRIVDGKTHIIREGGYHPRYMLSMGRIYFFLFADFDAVKEADVKIIIEGNNKCKLSSSTGVESLDDVLLSAAIHEDPEQEFIDVRVNRNILRVAIHGGSWYGENYGHRIVEGLNFMNTVSDRLKPHFREVSLNDFDITEFVN